MFMLKSSAVGLALVLATTICDRTFGAAFFRKSTVVSGHVKSPLWTGKMETISQRNHYYYFQIPRGGSTATEPDETAAAIEEVLYLPGLLQVQLKHSDNVRR
jgi:hypothetical protein